MPGSIRLIHPQPADYAWLTILAGTVVFELTADDLLSEGTDRYRAAHPWLTRLVIAAIAGHLGGVLPPSFDIFSAKNLLHRWAVRHYPWARTERLARRALVR